MSFFFFFLRKKIFAQKIINNLLNRYINKQVNKLIVQKCFAVVVLKDHPYGGLLAPKRHQTYAYDYSYCFLY